MLTIVTGKINSGKSTTLQRLYKKNLQGDGFVSIKTMKKNHPAFYHMQRLSSDEKQLFICRKNYCPKHYTIFQSIGPYRISADTVEWVNDIIEDAIEQRIEPLYFDEVGLLEIDKLGFYPLIKKMLASDLDLVLVVRKELLPAFEQTFNVTSYTIKKAV